MNDQVIPLYMEKQELLQHRAVVTKMTEGEINHKRYKWVQLTETIFHPKGGGQLNDEGTIDGIKVAYIHKLLPDKSRIDQFQVSHCFDAFQELPFKEGDEVGLIIDGVKRTLYSRMHTAGHLLAQSVKEVFPELEAHHGNHDPKDGYVKFKMLSEICPSKEDLLLKAASAIQLNFDKELPISVIKLPTGIRAIQIGEHAMPCGGTHVINLKKIGRVELVDVTMNKKENTVTVKYRLGE